MIFLWANIRNSWQVKPFGGGGGEETSWDLLSLQEWDWDTRILTLISMAFLPNQENQKVKHLKVLLWKHQRNLNCVPKLKKIEENFEALKNDSIIYSSIKLILIYNEKHTFYKYYIEGG